MIRDFSLVFLLLISDRRNLHRDSRRDTEQNVPCLGDNPSTPGDLFSFILLILLATTSDY